MYRRAKITNTSNKPIARAGFSLAPGATITTTVREDYLREIKAASGLKVRFLDDHPSPFTAPVMGGEPTEAQKKAAKKAASKPSTAAKKKASHTSPDSEAPEVPAAATDTPVESTADNSASDDVVTIEMIGNGWYEATDGRKFHGRQAVEAAGFEVPA